VLPSKCGTGIPDEVIEFTDISPNFSGFV